MITQLFGPVINLVGNGAYRSWTIGDWFLMKYGNLVMLALVAGLFLVGLVVNVPEHTEGVGSHAGHPDAEHATGEHVTAAPVEEHR
ncbi:MAG: hypothetical protein ACYCV7_10820 [Acidimicrobiales bacterium]